MSRETWCEHPGCQSVAVPGFDLCDPHLEEAEEKGIKVTDLGRTEPKPKKERKPRKLPPVLKGKDSPHWRGPEQRLESMGERFREHVKAEDIKNMSAYASQARALAIKSGLPIPEWATRMIQDDLDHLKGVAFECGYRGLPYSKVLEIMRKAWADGAIAFANGNASNAAARVRSHRNTLRRMRSAS